MPNTPEQDNDLSGGWAEDFAASHGVRLRFESPLPGNVPGYKYDTENGPEVVLDFATTPERRNFALAHEVAHILLGHSGVVEANEELEANHLASELLLPADDFMVVANLGLRELKEIFPHASFEAIARRRLQFVPGVLTIFDNGRMTNRIHSDNFNAPRFPDRSERETAGAALEQREDMRRDGEGFSYSATFVDDGRGVARVLLIVEEV